MPLRWTIDTESRKVDIVAEGDVTADDARAFFDCIEAAGVLSFDKLIDGTRGRAAMSSEELIGVAVRIRSQHEMSAMGALAVVMRREQAENLIRILGAAAVAKRPMKVFDELAPARRWLDGLSRRLSVAG